MVKAQEKTPAAKEEMQLSVRSSFREIPALISRCSQLFLKAALIALHSSMNVMIIFLNNCLISLLFTADITLILSSTECLR